MSIVWLPVHHCFLPFGLKTISSPVPLSLPTPCPTSPLRPPSPFPIQILTWTTPSQEMSVAPSEQAKTSLLCFVKSPARPLQSSAALSLIFGNCGAPVVHLGFFKKEKKRDRGTKLCISCLPSSVGCLSFLLIPRLRDLLKPSPRSL